MAKSTTARILDVWSQVATLDKKGKLIIWERLTAELAVSQKASEGDTVPGSVPTTEGV